MTKQIVIAEQHRIAAVFSEDQIQELVVATGSHQVSDIYLGIVENVLPGIDAAFVNIGDPERNGFMHVTDLGPLRLKRSAGAITELLTPPAESGGTGNERTDGQQRPPADRQHYPAGSLFGTDALRQGSQSLAADQVRSRAQPPQSPGYFGETGRDGAAGTH